MEITTDNLPWSSDDEFRWNAFLLTDTGKRLIPKLAERMPSLLAGGGTNEILIRNGEAKGFQLAIGALLELTHSPPLPPKTEFSHPDLEDDSKWSDGQITQR